MNKMWIILFFLIAGIFFGRFLKIKKSILKDLAKLYLLTVIVLLFLMGLTIGSNKEILSSIYQARDWDEVDGVFLLQERMVSKNWSWIKNRWIVTGDGETIAYESGHWVYSAVELQLMLTEAGFSRVDIYGDVEGRPYGVEAKRLVAAAWK